MTVTTFHLNCLNSNTTEEKRRAIQETEKIWHRLNAAWKTHKHTLTSILQTVYLQCIMVTFVCIIINVFIVYSLLPEYGLAQCIKWCNLLNFSVFIVYEHTHNTVYSHTDARSSGTSGTRKEQQRVLYSSQHCVVAQTDAQLNAWGKHSRVNTRFNVKPLDYQPS